MNNRGEIHHPEHNTNERPWGCYLVIDEGTDFKVKRISVLPGMRLSYQLHYRRSEHWFVIRGKGIATIADSVLPIGIGSTVEIPIGVPHRVANIGLGDLVFVEVQQGTYFGEDDIVRLADDFGRAGDPADRHRRGDC